MNATHTPSRAFAVWWKEFDRWSVSYFQSGRWYWPQSLLNRVDEFTKSEAIPITVSEAQKQNIPIISKINFGGELFLRNSKDYPNYKGRLFLVNPNRFIFSKINAKRGCIYYSPENQKPFAVSSEYPVLKLDTKKILGDYFNLAMRVGPAREGLVGSAAGMAKARTNLEDFKNIQIPLLSLAEQKAIVSRWRKAQDEIAAVRDRVKKRKSTIDVRFLGDLGLRSPAQGSIPKAFAVWWQDFLRWGVGFNFLCQSGADLTRGKYPVFELGALLELIQYGTSEKANTNADGVAVIRMNNILDGELDLRNLKHLQLSKNERERLLLKDGDILFNRTNSKELVGKCAVFHAQGEYVFASYLIRIRADSSKANPDFLAYVINCPIGRQQINALSRQIIGQANVNSVELRGLQIPLPPLSVQKQIMERVAAGRAEIAREREAADHLDQEIKAEIEALILGTKKVSDL